MELYEIIEDRLRILFNFDFISPEIRSKLIFIVTNFIDNTNINEINSQFTNLFVHHLIDFIEKYKNLFDEKILLIDEFITYFINFLSNSELYRNLIVSEEFIAELIFDIIEKLEIND